MPGALKNLIEWTIGGGSFSGTPVGWINCSPRPDGARLTYESLRVVLGYADARIVEDATAAVPVGRWIVDARGDITDAGTIAAIHGVETKLAEAVLEPHAANS